MGYFGNFSFLGARGQNISDVSLRGGGQKFLDASSRGMKNFRQSIILDSRGQIVCSEKLGENKGSLIIYGVGGGRTRLKFFAPP